MVSQTLETIKIAVPLIPLVLRHSLLHILKISESSQYLDLRSSLIITCLRALLIPSKPLTITATQGLTVNEVVVKGHIWVSRYVSPRPPETAVRDVLIETLQRLASGPGSSGPGSSGPRVPVPDFIDVEAEWTGYRSGVTRGAPLPDGSEKERYHDMMREVTRPTTILYFHGGAYYLCDPATHRPTTKRLAQLTGGRCYSVRYRLAPQHPFPAALLDAFVSYLTLLYPPPDAYHDPVQPEHIVVAGDSAGGNLSLALLQLIMQVRQEGSPVMWYGELRDVPLPAGVALNSPWVDVTQSSPTWKLDTPTPWDYLPKPETMDSLQVPPCDAWPSNPPRRNMYIADDLAAHPLASLVMAKSWKGAPPIYICTGWEILAHEGKYLAKKLESEGVRVAFEEYEAMPHCFALLLPGTPTTKRCYDGWAAFIRSVVDDPEGTESSAMTIKAKTLKEMPLRFDELSNDTDEDVRRRVLKNVGSTNMMPMAKL